MKLLTMGININTVPQKNNINAKIPYFLRKCFRPLSDLTS